MGTRLRIADGGSLEIFSSDNSYRHILSGTAQGFLSIGSNGYGIKLQTTTPGGFEAGQLSFDGNDFYVTTYDGANLNYVKVATGNGVGGGSTINNYYQGVNYLSVTGKQVSGNILLSGRGNVFLTTGSNGTIFISGSGSNSVLVDDGTYVRTTGNQLIQGLKVFTGFYISGTGINKGLSSLTQTFDTANGAVEALYVEPPASVGQPRRVFIGSTNKPAYSLNLVNCQAGIESLSNLVASNSIGHVFDKWKGGDTNQQSQYGAAYTICLKPWMFGDYDQAYSSVDNFDDYGVIIACQTGTKPQLVIKAPTGHNLTADFTQWMTGSGTNKYIVAKVTNDGIFSGKNFYVGTIPVVTGNSTLVRTYGDWQLDGEITFTNKIHADSIIGGSNGALRNGLDAGLPMSVDWMNGKLYEALSSETLRLDWHNRVLTGGIWNAQGLKVSGVSVSTGYAFDSDKLDGQQGSYYLNAGNLNAGTLPNARLSSNSAYYSIDPLIPKSNLPYASLGQATMLQASVVKGLMTNKLQFTPPAFIDYTIDWSTWSPYPTGVTDPVIEDVFLGRFGNGNIKVLSIPNGNWSGLRMVFDAALLGGNQYVYLDVLHMYVSTVGLSINVQVEKSWGMETGVTGWINVASGSFAGWPCHMTLPHTVIPWRANPTTGTHSRYVRLTIGQPAWRTDSYSGQNIEIYNVDWYGTYPNSNYPDSVYYWDFDKNVYFFSGVQGYKWTSTAPIGVAPFTVTSSTLVSNLNADMLDSQHSSYYASTGFGVRNLSVTGKSISGAINLSGAGNISIFTGVNNTIIISGLGSVGGAGTGSQTPWTGNVDGNTKTLTNVSNITAGTITASTSMATPIIYKYSAGSNGNTYINMETAQLYVDLIGTTVDWSGRVLSGDWTASSLFISGKPVTTGGPYYPLSSNPAGYLTTAYGVSYLSVTGRNVSGNIILSGQGGITIYTGINNTILISGSNSSFVSDATYVRTTGIQLIQGIKTFTGFYTSGTGINKGLGSLTQTFDTSNGAVEALYIEPPSTGPGDYKNVFIGSASKPVWTLQMGNVNQGIAGLNKLTVGVDGLGHPFDRWKGGDTNQQSQHGAAYTITLKPWMFGAYDQPYSSVDGFSDYGVLIACQTGNVPQLTIKAPTGQALTSDFTQWITGTGIYRETLAKVTNDGIFSGKNFYIGNTRVARIDEIPTSTIVAYSGLPTPNANQTITIDFSGTQNQLIYLTGQFTYTFTGSNYPDSGKISDIYLNIFYTNNNTAPTIFPSGWKNLGGGWPTGLYSGRAAMLWARAIDNTGLVVGTFNAEL
jgi:hypothetical protein